MRAVLIFVLAATALPAADNSPEGLRRLMRETLGNLRKSDDQIKNYTFTLNSSNKEYDGHGGAKTREVTLRREYVDGVAVSRVLVRDGQPIPEPERQKNEEAAQRRVAELKAMTAEERGRQDEQARKRRAEQDLWVSEFPDALDYKLAGEEKISGRTALVLDCSPHPGYHAHNLRARLFEKLAGKVWVDPEESEIMKADVRVSGDVSIVWGLVGRINQGTSFFLERTRVAPRVWLTSRQSANYSVHLLFKNLHGEQSAEYSDYMLTLRAAR
jgi:hypothetical protein